ncbi:hypothetical protein LSTR_LSTR003634 [Laodelphax striatellus]|uniref:Protein PTHB1 n=1 Tax=Laodelphax striatellus TaxID=195883 RepID=A0A482XBR9_LAOST|nr:hypothetical protein LSTR_LSTR003634 [Laodelphax striatellus]
MSLFRARELWSTQCGGANDVTESFDAASLLLVDLHGKQTNDSIVLASHAGVLRVYEPHADLEADSTDFKATHLLLETRLPEPILQLAYGKLVSGSQSQHLGVLHPLSLAVYNISIVAGSAEHGDQPQLSLVYEHQLLRSAFNVVVGPFGGARGRDFACVQSLDGRLTFFEQETLAFDRCLPSATFLLPSALVYVPQSDTFLTCNANLCLEAYRYGSLGDDSSRKLLPTWSYNLGEDVLDMQVLTWLGAEPAILVLGERHIFCLREGGALRFVKRLPFSPLCFHAYIVEPDGKLMILCVSDTKTLLVYEQTTLCWSAQLSVAPVLIKRINFQSLRGLILTLTEDGCLECSYLGTEPSLFVAPPTKKNLKSFEEAEHKYNQLQNEIATFSQNSHLLTQLDSAHEVSISLHVLAGSLDVTLNRCAVVATLRPSSSLNNVQLTFTVQPPLMLSPRTHFVSNLCDTCELISTVAMDTVNHQSPVFSLELQAVVAYLNSELTPQIIQTSIQLPLSLVLQITNPTSEATHKITLTSSQPVVPFTQLFREFVTVDYEKNFACSDTVIGFQHAGVYDSVVTIIISKSSTKYRVQAENMAAITLLVAQLKVRLESQTGNGKVGTPAVLAFNALGLPTQELVATVEQHVTLRNKVNELQTELGAQTAQFRVIQRRLLVKIRDKTPSSLAGLDALLKDAYNKILDVSHDLQHVVKDAEERGCELSSVLRLVLLLISISEGTVNQDLADLTAALSYTLHDSETQGWEEVSEAGVCYLLRTSLARSIRDQQRTCVNPLKEFGRFKKHIVCALERVVNSSGRPNDDARGVSPILEGDEPPGSRAGRRLSLDGADSESHKPRLLPLRKQNTVALENTQIGDGESGSVDVDVET